MTKLPKFCVDKGCKGQKKDAIEQRSTGKNEFIKYVCRYAKGNIKCEENGT